MHRNAWNGLLGSTLIATFGAHDARALPVPSRWMDPVNYRPTHVGIPPGPSVGSVEVKSIVSADRGRIALARQRGRVAIVVEAGLYDAISAVLVTYTDDLAEIGFSSTVLTMSGTAEFLRNTLIGLYDEPESLAGAVLIGELPYVIWEHDFWLYEEFACDLYFMDLDGVWADELDAPPVEPGNGRLDTWLGDRGLEIWVSRMRAGNLPTLGAESDLLNEYFVRNHTLRWDLLNDSHTGLVYIDDDWVYMGDLDTASLEWLFGAGNVVTITDPEETTADDYINQRLTADYQLVHVRSHGAHLGHSFWKNQGQDLDVVSKDDYLSHDPAAVLYSFFVCLGGDYTLLDNFAGSVVFNPEGDTLLAWATTKSGGMLHDEILYGRMALGESIGESFRHWFNQVKDLHYAPFWFYGMVLIGDGSLCEYPVDCNNNGILDDVEIPTGCGGLCAADCDPDCNCNGIPDACEAPDCDNNNVPDQCEIPLGCGGLCIVDCDPDCNCNGIMDGCEGDCNDNDIPDDCDTAAAPSGDCNTNAIPDECEITGGGGLLLNADFEHGLPAGWTTTGVFQITDQCGSSHPECGASGWAYAGHPDTCAYGDFESGELIAPPATLGYGPSELRFCSLLQSEENCDYATVSVNDTLIWYGSGDAFPWEEQVVELDAFVGQTVTIIFQFSTDLGGSGMRGWLVDNIRLVSRNLDCNLNDVPDECDIAGGTSQDLDVNGIPDECAPNPPVPESGGPPCTSAGECTVAYEGADCVGGTCCIPKNRYLSIDPTTNEYPVSLQVELTGSAPYPTAVGRTWWMDDPVCYDYPNGVPVLPAPPTCDGADRFGWVAGLTDASVTRIWTERPVHITDCAVVPATIYGIRASADRGASFTDALIANTAHNPDGVTQSWGDITGGPVPGMLGLWLAPERATNLGDVQAAIRTFENLSADTGFPPRVWVDVEIDQVVSLGDIQFIIMAFEGKAYADIQLDLIGVDPADCP